MLACNYDQVVMQVPPVHLWTTMSSTGPGGDASAPLAPAKNHESHLHHHLVTVTRWCDAGIPKYDQVVMQSMVVM